MSGWLRRIRGVIGMGLTWAVGWAPIGAVVGTGLYYLLPVGGLGLGDVVAINAITFAALGLVGGTIFATVLRVAEGRRRFGELSVPRFAAWGALGGLLLGGLAAAVGLWGGGLGLPGAVMIGASTLLGSGSAATTLVIARGAGDGGRLERGTGDARLQQGSRDLANS